MWEPEREKLERRRAPAAGLTQAGGERGVGHEAGITQTSVAAHRVHALAVGTHAVQLALVHIWNNTTIMRHTTRPDIVQPLLHCCSRSQEHVKAQS